MNVRFNSIGVCAVVLAGLVGLFPCCCVGKYLAKVFPSAPMSGGEDCPCCHKASRNTTSTDKIVTSSGNACACSSQARPNELPNTVLPISPAGDQFAVTVDFQYRRAVDVGFAISASKHNRPTAPPARIFMTCATLLI